MKGGKISRKTRHVMQDRYWMFRRSNGVFYVEDKQTGKQTSLRTKDITTAKRLFTGTNQAAEQPEMNMAMAKVYLSFKAKDMLLRTWDDVMKEMELAYHGSTLQRWRRQMCSVPFQELRKLKLLDTEVRHFHEVLRHPRAGSAAHKWLRIVHNRALDLGWLPVPVCTRRLWPKIPVRKTEALTEEQHRCLVEVQKDDEFRLYLQVLWETGGSQTDIACLHRDNIDMANRRLIFTRGKLKKISKGNVAIVIGKGLGRILAQLPQKGPLFPKLSTQTDQVRASRFRKRCDKLGFKDISLHSYRYAWAQRAKSYGMPLREAMAHLGHGSKAIHQAYSEKAEVVTFPLEYYEMVKRKKEKELQKQMAGLNFSEGISRLS